jgi:hypothetical protein
MWIDLDGDFDDLMQDLTLIRVNQVVIDYKPVNEETTEIVQAVIQVADPNKINVDKLDISKKHLQVNTKSNIEMGDLCEYRGDRYKAIALEDYNDYGYMEAYFEEVKSA